jgi:hypothetical protein
MKSCGVLFRYQSSSETLLTTFKTARLLSSDHQKIHGEAKKRIAPAFFCESIKIYVKLFENVYKYERSGVLSQCNVWLRTGWSGNQGSIPDRGKRFLPRASVSRPTTEPTQPPVQWVPGFLSPGLKRVRGVMLTTHPHLVPRSWMSRSYISSAPSASICVLWDCFRLPFYKP